MREFHRILEGNWAKVPRLSSPYDGTNGLLDKHFQSVICNNTSSEQMIVPLQLVNNLKNPASFSIIGSSEI